MAKTAKKPGKSRRTSGEIQAMVDAAAEQGYETQHTGVSWHSSRRSWWALGPTDPANGKKQPHLGNFDTDEAAARAYDRQGTDRP